MQALPPLNFKEAIKKIFRHYCKIKGRSRRSEYWNFFVFFIVQFIIGLIILVSLARQKIANAFEFFLSFFCCSQLALIIPLITVSIRRLHDTGKSGWYIFVNCAPCGYCLWFFYMYQDSDQKKNDYGPSPKYSEIQGNNLVDINENLSQQIYMLQSMQQMQHMSQIQPQIINNQSQAMLLNYPQQQMIQQPQAMNMAIPINQLRNFQIINQNQIPPLVQNQDFAPGIYHNN